VFHPVGTGPPYAAGVDRLIRLRAPLAVAALVLLSLVALARLALGLSELVGAGGSRAVAAARLAPNGSDAALTVAVGVLVVACFVAPAVPGRRGLARWTVLLTVVSVLATVYALALSDLEVAGWGAVWLIPDLAVPLLVAVVAAVLARRDPAAEGPPALAATAEAETAEEPAAAADPELQPVWTQDAAAGAVWRTAGEAARGAPATGWGSGETPWPAEALPVARPADDEPDASRDRPDPS
jgi:hypothetical protein